MFHFDIITIFPKIFDSYLNESILKRARGKKLVQIAIHNLRDFSSDKKHKKVDDKPYGGGAGMVLMAEPILLAVSHTAKRKALASPPLRPSVQSANRTKIVILSAKGKQFTQKLAHDWLKRYKRIVLISGRYEGIDERVVKALRAEEVSIGPYVLTDGDAAAMVVISSLTRLIPGVIDWKSLEEESHWNLFLKKEQRDVTVGKGLEYPHYTRPEVFLYGGKKYRVPKILLSGDHKKIDEWREKHTS